MDHKYFAYGSNLIVERITERIGKVKVLGTTALKGWGIRFNKLGIDGTGKCNILESKGETVYGVVYEITASQNTKLDKFEKGYNTVGIVLPLFGRCITYIANFDPLENIPNPLDWYKTLVVTGAKRHSFPVTYISQLSKQEATEDGNMSRRTINLRILK